jgi:hypothetical protein
VKRTLAAQREPVRGKSARSARIGASSAICSDERSIATHIQVTFCRSLHRAASPIVFDQRGGFVLGAKTRGSSE